MTHAATTSIETTAVFAEPTRRVSGRWIALFAMAWLGVWMAQLTPIQLLLPTQIQEQLKTDYWVDNVVAFGVVSGLAGLCALVAFPLTGALSDRTTSRFGRRRPWIASGALIFGAGLFILGLQTTMVGIGIFWCLSLTGFCVLTSALTATISDQVPVNQRGYVSGWLSAPQAVGAVLGILLALTLFVGTFMGYAAVGVLLIILVAPFLWVPDAVLTKAQRKPLTLRGILSDLWISPRKYPDFGWTLLSRVLVNFGNAFSTSLTLYFLAFGLNDKNSEDHMFILLLIYTVFVVISALMMGTWSDRLGRRKLFVFVSSTLQALGALLLVFFPSLEVGMISSAMFGAGYGCFLAVDQALATQVLPDPETRGKDLGIMNIATAVPQALAPLLGAIVVAMVAGFQGLYIMASLFALAGALAVSRVRSVR